MPRSASWLTSVLTELGARCTSRAAAATPMPGFLRHAEQFDLGATQLRSDPLRAQFATHLAAHRGHGGHQLVAELDRITVPHTTDDSSY